MRPLLSPLSPTCRIVTPMTLRRLRQASSTHSMAPVAAPPAIQDRRIAALSDTTTLIIQHDDSETAADATRQALRLHRAGRSCIEVLKDGFSLVADSDGGHVPAAADVKAGSPPTQPADPSPSDGGGSSSGGSGGSGGGDSNSSNSPSESGDEVVKVEWLACFGRVRAIPHNFARVAVLPQAGY